MSVALELRLGSGALGEAACLGMAENPRPFFSHVDLTGCGALSDAAAAALAAALTRLPPGGLAVLKLGACGLSRAGVAAITAAVRSHHWWSIETLELDGNAEGCAGPETAAAEHVASFLVGGAPRLKELGLAGTGFELPASFPPNPPSKPPPLERLTLDRCPWNASVGSAFLRATAKTLTRVSLGGDTLTRGELDVKASLSSLFKALDGADAEVEFGDHPDVLAALPDALADQTSVGGFTGGVSLSSAANRGTSASAIEALSAAGRMRRLTLHAKHTPGYSPAIASGWIRAVLAGFDDATWAGMVTAASSAQTYEQAVGAFSEALYHCLRRSGGVDDGSFAVALSVAGAIGRALHAPRDAKSGTPGVASGAPLERLAVTDRGLGPMMAIPLYLGVPMSRVLTHLHVEGCGFGDPGAMALGSALRANRTVVSVRWDKNDVELAGAAAVRGALHGNTKIVDMPFCAHDVTRALNGLGERWKRSLELERHARAAFKGLMKQYKGYPPLGQKNSGVESIKAAKVAQARARSEKNRLRRLTCEMAAAVARNNEVSEWKRSSRSEKRSGQAASRAEKKAAAAKAKAAAFLAETKHRVQAARVKALACLDKAAREEAKACGPASVSWFSAWRAEWSRRGFTALTAAGLAEAEAAFSAAASDGIRTGDALRAGMDAARAKLLAVAPLEARLRALQEAADEAAAEVESWRGEQAYFASLGASATNYKEFRPPAVIDPGLVDDRPPGVETRPNMWNGPYGPDWNGRFHWIMEEIMAAGCAPLPADYAGMAPPVATHDPVGSRGPPMLLYPPSSAPVHYAAAPAAPVMKGGSKTNQPASDGRKPYGYAPMAGVGALAYASFLVPPPQGAGVFATTGMPASPGVRFLRYDARREGEHAGRFHRRGHYHDRTTTHHHHHDHHDAYHDEGQVIDDAAHVDEMDDTDMDAEVGVEADAVDMYGGAGPTDLPDGGPRGGAAGSAVKATWETMMESSGASPRWRGAAAVAAAAVAAVVERRWGELCAAAESTLVGPTPSPVPLRAYPAAASASASGTPASDAEEEVTLVTQLSVDRLARLEAQVEAWPGPVSAAVYVSAGPDADAEEAAAREAEAAVAAAAARWERRDAGRPRRVHVSIVRPATSSPRHREGGPEEASEGDANASTRDVAAEEYDAAYPVNALRNVALDASPTDLVFLLDVDFVPSAGTNAAVAAANPARRCRDDGEVLVVPAFELSTPPRGGAGPRLGAADVAAAGVEGFRSASRARSIEPFHVGHYPAGHRATDAARWATTDSPYAVAYEEGYEPYVVASRSRIPRYDERFRGYGMNKVSHLAHCAARGLRFTVLPRSAFVVAEEHEKSPSWRSTFGGEADVRRRMLVAALFRQFKHELEEAALAKTWRAAAAAEGGDEGEEGPAALVERFQRAAAADADRADPRRVHGARRRRGVEDPYGARDGLWANASRVELTCGGAQCVAEAARNALDAHRREAAERAR